jgi:hypothetical protein
MTTEAPERSIPRPVPATMPVGGAVLAVVPQTVEEIQRVSNMVIAAGIAPQSLVKYVKDDASDDDRKAAAQRNIASVSTAIMAGAEVGLPPMAALRMFTVINGRPALYADGNVAVVRKAKDGEGKRIAEYLKAGVQMVYDYSCPYCGKVRSSQEDIRTHVEHAHKEDDPTEPGLVTISDKTFGWCEAKRADTGEIFREEFSITDAKLAKLWDPREEAEREVWEFSEEKRKRVPVKKMMPNDAPWHRFWKRMLMWRPTGYCLRWLFADVLGGMPDEYEARDMSGGMIDITPQVQPPSNGRPQPPQAPLPDEDENQDAANEAEAATATASDATNQPETATEGMTLAEADVARQAELHNSDQPAGAENEVTNDATAAMLGNRDPSIEEREAEARVQGGGKNPTQPGGADTTSTTSTEGQEAESSTLTTAEPPIAPEEPPEPGSDEWFERLEIYLKDAKSVDDIEALWVEMDVESELSSTSIATMDRADELKKHHAARVGGQGDLLGGQ